MNLYHHLIVNCTRACHTIRQSFVTLRVNKCNYICVTAGGNNKTNHVWFCVEDEGGDPRGAGGVSDTDRRLGKSLSDVTAGIATAGALTQWSMGAAAAASVTPLPSVPTHSGTNG